MIHNSNYATTSNKNAMGSTVSSLRDANKVWTAPLLPQARQCLPWGTSSRVVAEEKYANVTQHRGIPSPWRHISSADNGAKSIQKWM